MELDGRELLLPESRNDHETIRQLGYATPVPALQKWVRKHYPFVQDITEMQDRMSDPWRRTLSLLGMRAHADLPRPSLRRLSEHFIDDCEDHKQRLTDM